MTLVKVSTNSVLACRSVRSVCVVSLSCIINDLFKIQMLKFLMGSVFDGEKFFYVTVDATLV